MVLNIAGRKLIFSSHVYVLRAFRLKHVEIKCVLYKNNYNIYKPYNNGLFPHPSLYLFIVHSNQIFFSSGRINRFYDLPFLKGNPENRTWQGIVTFGSIKILCINNTPSSWLLFYLFIFLKFYFWNCEVFIWSYFSFKYNIAPFGLWRKS